MAYLFTLTAAVASIPLLWIQRQFTLNYVAVRDGAANGMGKEMAWLLLVLITTFTITTLILFLTGAGLVVGVRFAGYLLLLLPPIKLAGGLIAVRSLSRIRRLAQKPRSFDYRVGG